MLTNIYFRIYSALKRVRTNDTPAFNAMILFMCLQSMNISSIFGIINYYLKIDFTRQQAIYSSIVIFILLFIPNFKFFFGKLDIIKNKYQNESNSKRTMSNFYLIIYVLISLVIFFVIGETLVHKQY